MTTKIDKFYIIGIRYNPQLGSYLSKTIVAKCKVNKTCISAKFEEYGSTTSLKFYLHHDVTGKHYCKTQQDCVYGNYAYYGFSDKASAITELQSWHGKGGSSTERAKIGIEKFEAA